MLCKFLINCCLCWAPLNRSSYNHSPVTPSIDKLMYGMYCGLETSFSTSNRSKALLHPALFVLKLSGQTGRPVKSKPVQSGQVFSDAGPIIRFDSSLFAQPASTLQVRNADSNDIAPADIYLLFFLR